MKFERCGIKMHSLWKTIFIACFPPCVPKQKPSSSKVASFTLTQQVEDLYQQQSKKTLTASLSARRPSLRLSGSRPPFSLHSTVARLRPLFPKFTIQHSEFKITPFPPFKIKNSKLNIKTPPNQEQRTKNQEPRTKNQEPRTTNPDLGTPI